MDNDIAFELVDHVYALAKWVLDYIEKHDIPIVEDNEWMRFDFHLNRLESLLGEMGHPLLHNPIESRLVTAIKRPEDGTEPTRMFCCILRPQRLFQKNRGIVFSIVTW